MKATSWCGVDDAGRVAVFSTQSPGAVPRVLTNNWHALEASRYPISILATALDSGHSSSPTLDFGGTFRPGERVPARKELLKRVGQDFYVFLSEPTDVTEATKRGIAVTLPSTRGVVAIFRSLTDEWSERLASSASLLGVMERPAAELGGVFSPFGVAAMGLFVFEHACDGWTAGPYGRIAFPDSPLRVDAFPPAARDLLNHARLKGADFSRQSYVQPCNYVDCNSSDATYLSEDFLTHRSSLVAASEVGVAGKKRRYDVTPSWWREVGPDDPRRLQAGALLQARVPPGADYTTSLSDELCFDVLDHGDFGITALDLQEQLKAELERLGSGPVA